MRGSSGDIRASYGNLSRQPVGGGGSGSSAAAVDRLASGFSKLQGPSSVPSAGPLSKNGVSNPYSQNALLAQRCGRGVPLCDAVESLHPFCVWMDFDVKSCK